MIHLCNWRWAILVCGLALMVGVSHGMTDTDMYHRYAKFIDGINDLLALSIEYVLHTFVKLSQSGPSEKLEAVADHYSLVMKTAEPLFAVVGRDLQKVMNLVNDLSSANVLMRLLYDYFRQSAIDLIGHLKYVYNLD